MLVTILVLLAAGPVFFLTAGLSFFIMEYLIDRIKGGLK